MGRRAEVFTVQVQAPRKFEIGDWVTFDLIAQKERDYKEHSAHWVAIPYGDRTKNVGLYIGYRHKQNGVTSTASDGGGGECMEPPEVYSYFNETAPRTKVALVVVDARRNPIEVPFNNLRHPGESCDEA